MHVVLGGFVAECVLVFVSEWCYVRRTRCPFQNAVDSILQHSIRCFVSSAFLFRNRYYHQYAYQYQRVMELDVQDDRMDGQPLRTLSYVVHLVTGDATNSAVFGHEHKGHTC